MAKTDAKVQTHKDEFSRIFDEYRAKIDEISRKTVTNPPPGDKVPDAATRNNAEELEVTVSRVQAKPAGSHKESISPAELEAEEIILAAKRRAQQILDDAEDKSRKEASKRTQSQVEKIIGKARKDAEEMITLARQATEKESNEIVTTAKQEAEQFIREITEKARRETQTQSSRAIDETREKAEKMMIEIVSSCQEISQMVDEIIGRTRKTIDEFEARLQTDASDLAKAISATQQKLEQFTKMVAKEKEEVRPALVNKNMELPETPTLSVRILGAKSNGQHGAAPLFSGKVEMKSISTAFDYQYLKNLKKYLVHIPNIQYVQELASEKEISILFELKEPLPLLDILRNIPQVEEVITDADNISIVFKDSQ